MSWKIHGEGKDIIEIWEDFYGDLWFVTDKEGGIEFGYARLYSMPEMAEWGTFSIADIKSQVGEYKVWQVPRENWGNINTYEKGLIVEV